MDNGRPRLRCRASSPSSKYPRTILPVGFVISWGTSLVFLHIGLSLNTTLSRQRVGIPCNGLGLTCSPDGTCIGAEYGRTVDNPLLQRNGIRVYTSNACEQHGQDHHREHHGQETSGVDKDDEDEKGRLSWSEANTISAASPLLYVRQRRSGTGEMRSRCHS